MQSKSSFAITSSRFKVIVLMPDSGDCLPGRFKTRESCKVAEPAPLWSLVQ
jgi:hypothetical protein